MYQQPAYNPQYPPYQAQYQPQSSCVRTAALVMTILDLISGCIMLLIALGIVLSVFHLVTLIFFCLVAGSVALCAMGVAGLVRKSPGLIMAYIIILILYVVALVFEFFGCIVIALFSQEAKRAVRKMKEYQNLSDKEKVAFDKSFGTFVVITAFFMLFAIAYKAAHLAFTIKARKEIVHCGRPAEQQPFLQSPPPGTMTSSKTHESA